MQKKTMINGSQEFFSGKHCVRNEKVAEVAKSQKKI